jgi:hypothetical protein
MSGNDYRVSAGREPLILARSQKVWKRASTDLFA